MAGTDGTKWRLIGGDAVLTLHQTLKNPVADAHEVVHNSGSITLILMSIIRDHCDPGATSVLPAMRTIQALPRRRMFRPGSIPCCPRPRRSDLNAPVDGAGGCQVVSPRWLLNSRAGGPEGDRAWGVVVSAIVLDAGFGSTNTGEDGAVLDRR